MDIKIFCPLWGNEQRPAADFFRAVKDAGYHGVETWLPEDNKERTDFLDKLHACDLLLITHQHEAVGATLAEYLRSFEHFLSICREGNPLMINSHSGKDWFSFEDQKEIIRYASDFSARNNIEVLHEIHRGRIGYSPASTRALFDACPEMRITADFSHWVCVSESLHLTGFENVLEEGIQRAGHIHARVGFAEGPQIPDPRAGEWAEEVKVFFGWWDRIIENNRKKGRKQFTITPEFGPFPYMWRIPFTQKDISNQWELNNHMKNEIRMRYSNMR